MQYLLFHIYILLLYGMDDKVSLWSLYCGRDCDAGRSLDSNTGLNRI